MGKTFVVNANWDNDAQVWIATSQDIPGLCAEAPTFEELTSVVITLAPELLEANGMIIPGGRLEIPLNILAQRFALAHQAA